MRRAQQRDAVNQAKFYFRREIFTPTSSRATSGAATPEIITVASSHCPVPPPSTNGFANGFHGNHNGRPKQRMMENCFPPLPLPEEGLVGGNVNEEYGEYTISEIINGKVDDVFPPLFYRHHTATAAIANSTCYFPFLEQGDSFPGLIGLVEKYIGTLDLSDSESHKISSYLDLVRRRADGSLKTAATWIRDFVRSHPSYKFDSVVNKEINYDLVVAVDEM
jgi:glutamate--cysteine ligase catalytic subunit